MLKDSIRIGNIQKPIIPLLAKWISESPGTISLAQGMVHYPPPSSSFDYLKDNLNNPTINKYNVIEGIPELSEQIATKLNSYNSISIVEGVNKTFVSAGANMAFFNIIFSITNPDDEIIILSPYYFNYEMAIQIAGCKVVSVPTNNSYQPDLNSIKHAITPKTQAIVTISPNNPTGVIYKKELLVEINNLCKENSIFHISDEAYEYFTYNNKKHFSPASLKDSASHTISIFSLSKTFGMAGWRIGYCAYPDFLDTSIKKVQDTDLICAPIVSQYLASSAMKTGTNFISPYIKELEDIKNNVIQRLNGLNDKISFTKPDGAFYIFIKINTNKACIDLTKELISKYKVAVVPGATFGMNKGCYLRLAFGALNKQTVTEGINRFVSGITNLT